MKIVTGMHRSGTSFISQALHEIGANFGDTSLLFPADKWNAKGYFENINFIDINNKLILGLKADIDDWLKMPEDGLQRKSSLFRTRKWKYFLFPSIDSINRNEIILRNRISTLAKSYSGVFVKDPRFCLTLRAWSRNTDINEIVFIYRSRSEVAKSIRRREGLPLWFGYRFWNYHIENFFSGLPEGTKLMIFKFDNFFNNNLRDAEFDRLIKSFSTSPTSNNAVDLSRVLDVRLRTQTSENKLPNSSMGIWNKLEHLHAENPRPFTWERSYW
jgi:hypothetical protein